MTPTPVTRVDPSHASRAPTERTPNDHPARLTLSLALAVLACAITIAACGSSNKPHSTGSSSYNADVKIAACMRAHGVSNFPDPSAAAAGQGAGGFSIQRTVGSPSVMINGISVGGPAYQSAAKTCRLSAAVGAQPLSEAQKQGMIAKAHCMRAHGVPNFPDPFFGPGGRGSGIHLPPGFNPQAPAVLRAAKACASVGTAVPGAGVG
jgi:hypothetical protein